MATFEAQVEGLTTLALTSSSTPTQNQLSQFLKDGVLDVTNKWLSIRPEDAENFQRSTSTSDSQGVSVGGSKIISVIREANLDGSADGTVSKSLKSIVPRAKAKARSLKKSAVKYAVKSVRSLGQGGKKKASKARAGKVQPSRPGRRP